MLKYQMVAMGWWVGGILLKFLTHPILHGLYKNSMYMLWATVHVDLRYIGLNLFGMSMGRLAIGKIVGYRAYYRLWACHEHGDQQLAKLAQSVHFPSLEQPNSMCGTSTLW